MLKKIQQFLKEVQFELKKVSWPTWEELRGSTIIVLFFSIMLGTILFLIDWFFTLILRSLL